MYHAAKSRAKADWLVGINATRALTCKHNAQLSCGRVQTPTLAIIAEREAQIRSFKPEEYFGLTCYAGGIAWIWQNKNSGSFRTFQKDSLLKLKSQLNGASLSVTEVKKSAKKTYSPGLYDLTELQRDANMRFGFSAKQTLNIMQRLYETHKVLTYPRTDSRYIGNDIVPTIKERLKACNIGPYKKFIPELLKRPLRVNKSFVDDKKVSDHHAIIPTEEYVQLDHMSNEERKIYDLVVRRFLSVLSPAFEYEQTTLSAIAADEQFTAKGKLVKSAGWKSIYENNIYDDSEDICEETDSFGNSRDTFRQPDQSLPDIRQGSHLSVTRASLTSQKTKPPARFTEATLLSAMENPVKYMESQDKKARKTLSETGGLGTVATRADIIEKLFHSFLIEKKGNELHITSKGKQLLALVPEDLKKPELTAQWEMKLADIAQGSRKEAAFIRDIEAYTHMLIHQIKSSDGAYRHDNLTNAKCPRCGKRMLSVNGKNARLLVCQDRECGYRETIARLSNARCPNCHKKMEILKKGGEETLDLRLRLRL